MILGIESLENPPFLQFNTGIIVSPISRAATPAANQSEAITMQQPLVGPKLPNSFWKVTISRDGDLV